MDRSKFVHEIHDYADGHCLGMTTDIYMLPVGTKFSVDNGYWDGEIVEKDGIKMIYAEDADTYITIKDDVDYSLLLTITYSPQMEESVVD